MNIHYCLTDAHAVGHVWQLAAKRMIISKRIIITRRIEVRFLASKPRCRDNLEMKNSMLLLP